MFGERPDAFVRIQVGSVRGEVLDAQARMLSEQFLPWFALMGAGVVQQYNHRAPQMPEEMAEEDADLLLPDVPEPKLVVEAEVLSFRTDGDSRDEGDLVSPIAMTNDRGAATGRPGLDDIGDQQEPGFVGENEVGTQPRSVFFTRGQSFCFQRSMARSSRSTARRSGF